MKTISDMEMCKNFDKCSAPLCPLDTASLESSIWYPDEEVCTLLQFAGVPWVRRQKKITKRAANKDFYFTHKMLCRDCVIGSKIEGIDPDHDLKDMGKDESDWLEKHPQKRMMTDEEKGELRDRMFKLRKAGLMS